MSRKTKIIIAALLATALHAASAMELKVNGYTSNSVTFSLTGTMPSTNPGTLQDGPNEIDLLYTGNLWAGGTNFAMNAINASPIVGAGNLFAGNTGGFAVPTNYSWMYFDNDLTGLEGSGQQVTLTFASGAALLNTLGTGTIDLYWGNLYQGADASGVSNILLSSVSIVNGVVQATNAVPEPASLGLLAMGAFGLTAARRRKDNRA
jgi:hypothetical protein